MSTDTEAALLRGIVAGPDDDPPRAARSGRAGRAYFAVETKPPPSGTESRQKGRAEVECGEAYFEAVAAENPARSTAATSRADVIVRPE